MTLPNLKYYYIDSQISSGGTAAVYRGIDLRSGYEVAIKALFPHRAKDSFVKKRFREEANHYLYLSHPNITKLVDFIEDGDNYYLVMEFVDGIPLDDYIKSTGPLSDSEITGLFLQVLDTIAYLHQNRVLHLDIKPSNMMVVENEDGSKRIKILDMGISAKINDKSNNIKKCGSPAFMAPEQINQNKLGFFTDIFALGVTLFNIITMKLPFLGNNHTEIFEKICNEPTPSIKDVCENVNPLYQPIIERALSKNGADRYQTCEEFMIDIYSIIDSKNKKMKVVRIGRSSDNDIVISDSSVSRNHLEIIKTDSGGYLMKDLNSRNGTYVNGRRIKETDLIDTDIIRIGNTTLPWLNYFKYSSEYDNLSDTEDLQEEKHKKRKKRNFNFRNVLSIIMTILSLLLMMFALLRYMK